MSPNRNFQLKKPPNVPEKKKYDENININFTYSTDFQ